MNPSSNNNRKILIIHHVEPIWEGSNGISDRDELLGKLIAHLRHNKYDEIILTQLEETRWAEYSILNEAVDRIEQWTYGYEEPDFYENDDCGIRPEDIIEVPTVHNYALIHDWMKILPKDAIISVCGGHREECLADLEYTLEYLGIEYKEIEDCIYG